MGICKPVVLVDILEIHKTLNEAIRNDLEPRHSTKSLRELYCHKGIGASDRLTLKYIKSVGPQPPTDIFVLSWNIEILKKNSSLLLPSTEEAAERTE